MVETFHRGHCFPYEIKSPCVIRDKASARNTEVWHIKWNINHKPWPITAGFLNLNYHI